MPPGVACRYSVDCENIEEKQRERSPVPLEELITRNKALQQTFFVKNIPSPIIHQRSYGALRISLVQPGAQSFNCDTPDSKQVEYDTQSLKERLVKYKVRNSCLAHTLASGSTLPEVDEPQVKERRCYVQNTKRSRVMKKNCLIVNKNAFVRLISKYSVVLYSTTKACRFRAICVVYRPYQLPCSHLMSPTAVISVIPAERASV